jgi:flagellar biosynthesis protein FliR
VEAYATANQVYAAGLVFARVGALMMLIPGIGESYVPPRIRLSFALVFAIMIFPLLAPGLPPAPATVGSIGAQVIKEILIGLMMGAILRMFLSSLAAAGEIVSLQTTLSFAQSAAPGQAQPSTTLSTFLGLMGIVLLMAVNLHHMFFAAVVNSYKLFPVAAQVPTGDAAELAIRTVGGSFALGLQLAAPVVVFSLIFNIAVGLVGRVMPQFQVFFAATPLAVLFGLSIFALSLGALGMVWIDRYRELLANFV